MKPSWVYLLSFVAVSALGGTPNEIAWFRLVENNRDSSGGSSSMSLSNAPFVHRTLYLNGQYEYGISPSGYHATATVPSLDYESLGFSIDFYPLEIGSRTDLGRIEDWFNSLTRGYYARLFRRSARDNSNILTGGSSYRWLGFRRENNVLQLTLNNQAFTHIFTGAKVGPGRWHNLMCSLDLHRKQVLTMLDGQSLPAIDLPQDFRLEVIGTPNELSDRQFTFVNYSIGSVFYGFAANLKVFGRSLTGSELAALYVKDSGERPGFKPISFPFFMISLIVLAVVGASAVLLIKRWRSRSRENNPRTSSSGVSEERRHL